jgi:hypothetical protein
MKCVPINTNSLGNVTDELIAITTNDLRNGKTTVQNRTSVSLRDTFTKFMGTSATVSLGNMFTLPVSFASTNGNYTFGLQVGEFTETIVVTVVSPTAELEIDVLDLTNNEALTATNGVYQVTLDELDGDVTIAFDVTVLNARPSESKDTYTDTGYVLTRDFNGDWNDVRTNVATSTNLPGNDGHLYFSPTVSGVSGGLVQIMQGVQPNTHETSLVLDEPGEYSFKLVVGNAVKEFTIEVEDFSDLLTESIIISHFESLKSKGLMDSIDDPNIGDEVYFITPAGKELVELARKVDAIKPINKKSTVKKKTTKKKEK